MRTLVLNFFTFSAPRAAAGGFGRVWEGFGKVWEGLQDLGRFGMVWKVWSVRELLK